MVFLRTKATRNLLDLAMKEIPIETRNPANVANSGKSSLFQRVNYLGPLIVWAGVIFIMSSRVGIPDNSLGVLESLLKWIFPGGAGRLSADRARLLNLLVRKLGHLSEYFIFALLAVRAQRNGRPRIGFDWALKALALSTGYACSDELHQYFVAGRTGAVADVLIDSIGASAALLLVLVNDKRRRHAPRDRSPADPLEESDE